MTAIAVKHSSDWINALPNEELSLKFNNNEYSTLIKLWTGTQFTSTSSSCLASNCNKALDKHGHHALTCLTAGDRLTRHNLIRKWTYNLAKEALCNPSEEENNIIPGHPNLRPADVFLPLFSLNKPAAIDITITSPIQPRFQESNNHLEPLQASRVSELAKHLKYDHFLQPLDIHFIPFALEVFGGVGKEAQPLLKDLLRKVSTHQNMQHSDAVKYHMTLLSVTLQRANARSILSRLPESM